MSDSSIAPPSTAVGMPQEVDDFPLAAGRQPGFSAAWFWLLAAIGAAALVSSGVLWQKLSSTRAELARRVTDSSTQAIEARTLSRQAQEGMRDLTARLALQEARIAELALQRGQLEELMQSLSRSRDENLVLEIESAVRAAQQQAQLSGSVQPLVAALQSADQRLARAAQPRLNALRRSVAKDLDRVRLSNLTDVPSLMVKVDELIRLTDDLPLANSLRTEPPAGRNATAPAAPASVPAGFAEKASQRLTQALDGSALKAWAQRVSDSVRDEARNLLRVSRIDQPEAALLAPEQAFFLRENLKLRLLNARLGLLVRQTEGARADLASAGAWLARYFDPASRRTQTAAGLLQQVQGQLKSSELPRLDDTLSALATAAAGR